MRADYQLDASLPALGLADALTTTLGRRGTVVLAAPPGSGKTTALPLALLDAPWLAGQRMLLLEPRRLAARLAAQRMAEVLGEEAGETVGYRVRFDSKVSDKTRIEVVTEGILTRRLQRDPELAGVGLVIFDEFHERHLQTDLGLALCRDVQSGLRDDLHLLVMSATIDVSALASWLDAEALQCDGRQHDVGISYLGRQRNDRDARQQLLPDTMQGVQQALAEQPGDILVFLPGVAEIRRCAAELARTVPSNVAVLPLFGDLDRRAQQEALQPRADGSRRIVLATDIAESSLTIQGVRSVVDAGWVRKPQFDAASGMSRLQTRRVSEDSATQRAGRAGRLGPGHCYRLWSAGQTLAQTRRPELLEADLAPLLLELHNWGVSDPSQLQWLDPPPAGAVAQAEQLLQMLGALDDKARLTSKGRRLASLPLHPRLAALLLAGEAAGQQTLACDLAALLSERDLLRNAGTADLAPRLAVLRAYRERGAAAARQAGADPAALHWASRAIRQWRRLLNESSQNPDDDSTTGALLAAGWPDRVGQRISTQNASYRLANGRAVTLAADDPLRGEAWIVAADTADRSGRSGLQGMVRLAAAVDLGALREQLADLLRHDDQVSWDSQRQAVNTSHQERLGNLVLSETALSEPPAAACLQALLSGLRSKGLQVLPWTESARQFCARIECLRAHGLARDWPSFAEDALLSELEDWLGLWLDGVTRLDALQRLPLMDALQQRLSWDQQQALARLAPTQVNLRDGQQQRLNYALGERPVLAVRLQQCFGLQATPSIGNGRIPLLLHLLSPAGRPLQITDDLPGFWAGSYAEVRKEMRGRYPKHPWPEDPANAAPPPRGRLKN